MSFLEVNTDLGLKHYGYPSIEQFRNVIYNVKHKSKYVGKDENNEPIYNEAATLPKLSFVGSVKLHGTNCGIVFDFKNEVVYYQSRENVITPLKDNAGSATYLASIQPKLVELVKTIDRGDNDVVVLFGEWCGGNIQKGVAISGLDKMFVILDVRLINTDKDTRNWLNIDKLKTLELPEHKVRNIWNYETYQIDVDFAYPELSQNKLIEITDEVERQCPFGKSFDKEGIGEGVVWKCITPEFEDSGYWMKVKGEKHSNSKVKTVVAVDVEKISNIRQFCETYVTENRCLQSIDKLKEADKPLTRASLGDFLRWIVNDIYKEEMDTILKNGFEMKELGSPISNKAREWFFKNEINF